MEAGSIARDLDRQHRVRLDWLERAEGPILTLATHYPAGYRVDTHRHSRSQLLQALSGIVTVETGLGRWMVPPDHAVWIPGGTDHAVEMRGAVAMYSVYVAERAVGGLPETLRVVAMTPLMRALIGEAERLSSTDTAAARGRLILDLILHEIPLLPERPLALPLPVHPRMAALCRAYVDAPSPRMTIDDFAGMLGMSRRSFTRAFQRETGLSLMKWRQQACLFAALPRLSHGEPVTQVALDLGYESVAAFTTMFKRTLGTAPTRYLESMDLR